MQSHEQRARLGKLHPNTTYVFSVRTVAGKRGSSWSKVVTATTAVLGESRGERGGVGGEGAG